MNPGNDSGDQAHPGTEEDSAGHDSDDPHIHQRPLDINPRVGPEDREQTEDNRHHRQLLGSISALDKNLFKPRHPCQSEETHQQQRRSFEQLQQYRQVMLHSYASKGQSTGSL
ncbi:hypothetical protein D3C74_373830 [compost metagenome]